jgi:hypothetical protein
LQGQALDGVALGGDFFRIGGGILIMGSFPGDPRLFEQAIIALKRFILKGCSKILRGAKNP